MDQRIAISATEQCGAAARDGVRQDWTRAEVRALFELPFPDLIYQAQSVHRAHFDATLIQISTLLSIKTGGCPEDCAYCPQSARFDTGLKSQRLMAKEVVLAEAEKARSAGATRFCMGAAWRAPKDHEVDLVAELVAGVKDLGLETCATLGMLTAPQAEKLKTPGSTTTIITWILPESLRSNHHHPHISGPPGYARPRARAGIRVCCGGILGMGESREDRVGMIVNAWPCLCLVY